MRSTWGLLFDLLAVAYQADMTRVGTLMMAREVSQVVFPNLGHHRALASLDVASRQRPAEARRTS